MNWLVFFVIMSVVGVGWSYQKISRHGNIALLDHFNVNHKRGGHDLLKSFYYETLGFSIDPRKEANLVSGSKTLWANAGITQLHLPEAEDAQIFDGIISIAYASQAHLDEIQKKLPDNRCEMQLSPASADGGEGRGEGGREEGLRVLDPWGSSYFLFVDEEAKDKRGVQPGEPSVPLGICDINVFVPDGANLQGIARFYNHVFGGPCVASSEHSVSIATSPTQTLTFSYLPDSLLPLASDNNSIDDSKDSINNNAAGSAGSAGSRNTKNEKNVKVLMPWGRGKGRKGRTVEHAELVEWDVDGMKMKMKMNGNNSNSNTVTSTATTTTTTTTEDPSLTAPTNLANQANLGVHVSMYVHDFQGAYERAENAGCLFVNRRFSQQAFSKDEAVEQGIFRTLLVVDPDDVMAGPIIRLEHEIRSIQAPGGFLYDSCPFYSTGR